jgi:3-isopropylmalate/(R)-2-methylmalate dehydratase small subunit
MDILKRIQSSAAPIMNANIDTDVITPMQRITRRSNKPMSYYAFESLRFVGGDGDEGEAVADFPLNQDKYRGARIMICGENFGCGSSRESAPAAIADLGFRCLIGSSFGDIFFNNCFQQGILPIVVTIDVVRDLEAAAETGAELTVDLPNQEITTPGGQVFSFQVNALRKKSLLQALDDIELTMQRHAAISTWQEQDEARRPWIYQSGKSSG